MRPNALLSLSKYQKESKRNIGVDKGWNFTWVMYGYEMLKIDERLVLFQGITLIYQRLYTLENTCPDCHLE